MRVRRGGVNVRVNLVWKITRRGLVVQAAGTQRRDKARVGRAVVPVRVGVHGGESKLTQRRDGFYIPAPFFSFSRVATSGSNKINLNSIHSLSAKLAIPFNPHLLIIVLSCASKISTFHPPMFPSPTYLIPRGAFADGSALQVTPTQARRDNSQGVVSICSPVNTAFAPAIKHIVCSGSLSICRPAARRMIVLGRTIRAVATVRSTVGNGTG